MFQTWHLSQKFQIQLLDARSRTLGEEHPGMISAMGDLSFGIGDSSSRVQSHAL